MMAAEITEDTNITATYFTGSLIDALRGAAEYIEDEIKNRGTCEVENVSINWDGNGESQEWVATLYTK